MSADLEFRLPIIKIISAQNSDVTDVDGESCTSEEDCHTPRSPRHIIPPVLSCPPAPRKLARRRSAASCKRKLCELEFFEIVAREEVESFFRTAEESINGGNGGSGGGASKRRCVM